MSERYDRKMGDLGTAITGEVFSGRLDTFFWSKKKARELRRVILALVNDFRLNKSKGSVAGYRGYVTDSETRALVCRTPLWYDPSGLNAFLCDYIEIMSAEVIDVDRFEIHVMTVFYNVEEPSDSDLLEEWYPEGCKAGESDRKVKLSWSAIDDIIEAINDDINDITRTHLENMRDE